MHVFLPRVRWLTRRRRIGSALLVAGVAVVLPVVGLAVNRPVSSAGPAADPTLPVLVRGAQLHGANGLNIGPDGRLRVASSLGSEIVEVNRLTGAILARSGISAGVQSPDDLRFGPDGSLYWVSILTGNVVRRSPSGKLTQQFIALGVDGITFSSDGRLFVSLDFFGDALYEVDPALTAPPRLIARNLGFLNGMDWGRDGRLYAPVWMQGKVVSIGVDSCTNAVDPYVQCDIKTVADGFFIPASVKFDGQGRLHAVDQNGDVVRIDGMTGKKKLIATLPPGLDNLVFDANGDLYVSSASDGFVVRIDAAGRVTPVLRSGLILPAGVAVVGGAGNESVYVADFFALRKFDARTGAQLDQAPVFLAFSALQAPSTVSADGTALLLTSWLGNTVQVWDPATKSVLASYSDFAVPLNAIRFQGDLVVAELGSTPGTARVVRQTSSGRVTLAAMAVPSGLAATGRDLWAADYANGTVLQLVANGVTLSPPITVASGLKQPEGLAVDGRGRLLVVESGARRLLRIDPSTRSSSVVYKNLEVGLEAPSGVPPTYALSSVAVGPTGTIYVSGDAGNLIYKGNP